MMVVSMKRRKIVLFVILYVALLVAIALVKDPAVRPINAGLRSRTPKAIYRVRPASMIRGRIRRMRV